jgi:hypothetical protein
VRTSPYTISANFACTEFSEDEMRRPTLHTQYPWRVCNGYAGSPSLEAQSKGGSAHE